MVRLVGITVLTLVLAPASWATDPTRLLIIDGQNNHDWRTTTPFLREILQESGRFTIDVATTPSSDHEQYAIEMARFRPDFASYDVILLNYNGDPWPEETHDALEAAVRNGKGLVVVHAANNAFPGRSSYERMIGLGWRPKDAGPRLEIGDEGQLKRIEAGQGPDSGHGKRHQFQIAMRAEDHPIARGMPRVWMHTRDELYHGLRGPAEDLTIIATAFSDPDLGGTGKHEPMAWTVGYGQGRVFHTALGHDVEAMRCVGFATLLTRGAEWAATGEVTIAIPDDFPTADSVSTRGGWWGDLRANYGPPLRRYWPFGVLIALLGITWLRWRRRRPWRVAN